MLSHWTSFKQGGFTGVAGAGIAEVSDALASEAARYSQVALSHTADLAQILHSIAAYLV